jgi:uncharacterized protein YbjT (DUF2867 family)
MIQKIAFIGATGLLGNPVATELVRSGFAVTALVRDESKAKQLLPSSVNLISGDVQNMSSLQKLMSGQDALYLNLNVKPNEGPKDFHTETDGLKNIIGVARSAGISRIAFISSLVMRYQGMNNFHWWVFDIKHKAVRLIQESGIPYSIFYPSTFMENFETNYRRGKKILLAGRSEHKMYFISVSDYAKQVARSFQVLRDENRDYVVQGLEGFTADEAAREYFAHYKKEKLRISKAPLSLISFFGKFNRTPHYLSHIIEAINRFPETFEAENTWAELGRPEITLRDFAARES